MVIYTLLLLKVVDEQICSLIGPVAPVSVSPQTQPRGGGGLGIIVESSCRKFSTKKDNFHQEILDYLIVTI
jgi:hypothetical protein